MKTIHYIIVGSIGFITLLSSCGSTPENKEVEVKAPVMMTMNKETIQVQKMNPTISVKLPGELVADQEVQVYAKVPSYVKELKVDVGSEVKAGEVLMRLEAPEINSQLAATHSKLKAQEAIYISTKATYDRVLRANETEGAVSGDAVDQIIAKKEAAEAQLAAAKSSYNEIKAIEDYLVVRAPFSGIVTERNTDVGAYVGPAGKGSHLPLLVVQKNDALRLVLAIPEAYTSYVHQGDSVSFVAKSIPQTLFVGTVARKSGALDTKLRTEHIEVDVKNQNKNLLPRMVVDATLGLRAKESTLFIPKSALVDSNVGVYVMQIVEGKTKKTPVRKGRNHGMMVEVFGELSPGDTLLKMINEETKENMQID